MKKLATLLLVLSVFRPAPAQEVVFNYRPEDRAFLHYYSVWNQFDSSAVMYEFGEVAVVSGAAVQRVPMSANVRMREKIQGRPEQGISTDLEQLARTCDFTLPGSGEIRWFSQLQAFRTPCDPYYYDTTKGEGPNRPVSNWGILDRTEFVLQLVRTEDGVVLAVLDSMGVVATNPDAETGDTRYGANLRSVRRTAAIPGGHESTKVFVRLSPRRYGPTPLGLTLSKNSHWVNRSALYDSAGVDLTGDEAALRSRWFRELLHYCDSVKAQTGWLPDLRGVSFRGSQITMFYNRYYDPRVNSRGDTIWHERYTKPASKGAGAAAVSSGNDKYGGPVPVAIIRSVSPHPVTSDIIEVHVAGMVEMRTLVRLTTMQGESLGVLWSGAVNNGETTISVPVPHTIADGSYMLVLENDSGAIISSRTIAIVR